MLPRWISTVRGLISSQRAISLLEQPALSSSSTSRSRRLSSEIARCASTSRRRRSACFGEDAGEAAGEAAHLQRQAQEIERAGLDRSDDPLERGLGRRHDDRQPQTARAKASDQLAGPAWFALVGSEYDSLVRRPLEQLVEVRIDLGVMAEREGDARLIGARAALAAYDVQSGPFHGVAPAA